MYSYDILDNLGRPGTRSIIPELRHVTSGDIIPMSRSGKQGMRFIRSTHRTR
jgi:hypothetical protein